MIILRIIKHFDALRDFCLSICYILSFVQVFSNHKALLDSGICDVLVVSTPNCTHAEILLDILDHKIPHHILVEKPLCTKIEDCYRVCISCNLFMPYF